MEARKPFSHIKTFPLCHVPAPEFPAHRKSIPCVRRNCESNLALCGRVSSAGKKKPCGLFSFCTGEAFTPPFLARELNRPKALPRTGGRILEYSPPPSNKTRKTAVFCMRQDLHCALSFNSHGGKAFDKILLGKEEENQYRKYR
jgi:hypothetical protein